MMVIVHVMYTLQDKVQGCGEASQQTHQANVDWVVIVLYFLMEVFIGWHLIRKKKSWSVPLIWKLSSLPVFQVLVIIVAMYMAIIGYIFFRIGYIYAIF